MNNKLFALIFLSGIIFFNTIMAQDRKEQYRPEFHFSPKSNWMNDPNGMVYFNGKYHLFFQHNPNSSKWGPMHWGHAISKDLVSWEEQKIALAPDSLGAIFSGSAVVDKNNSAGFGENALVAIFTHHNSTIEKEGTGLHQYQSIAYSNDEGKTWTKYKGNPVLPNPGIEDFRDPKVMWHEPSQQWVMTLATKQTITFYGSTNLKSWNRLSEFGEGYGAHGGVWECPDLISFDRDEEKFWVLLVSINPGGPSGGSATQYFVGHFDGKTFKPLENKTKWVDYGADNYAGITWSNTGNKRLFIGWMNNWNYANIIPTQNWRGAATVARELQLQKIDREFFLSSNPVPEFEKLVSPLATFTNHKLKGQLDLSKDIQKTDGIFKLELVLKETRDFSIVLANEAGNELLVGYDKKLDNYYIDRTKSGKVNFEPGFAARHIGPRIAKTKEISLTLLVDAGSVELFADDGLTVMTDLFFSEKKMNKLYIRSLSGITINQLKYSDVQKK
jgi:fructan beta-fructosidase